MRPVPMIATLYFAVTYLALLLPRIEAVSQAIANEIDRQHGEQDHDARRYPDPRILLQAGERTSRVQHFSPTRRWWQNAEPEEAQGRLGEDGAGNAERARHQHRGKRVWQNVFEH